MLDHIGLAVTDVAKSKSFFEAALKPLGYTTLMDFGEAIAMGEAGKPGGIWIAKGKAANAAHIAFVAPNRAAVSAFHKAAMAAGGRDNGAPGLRTQYHPNYFGAFVHDPDGNNVEAVCHQPE